MREGEGDDLAGIGRVGQDLLIAAHRGVEADLADPRDRCAQATPPEHRAVREDKGGGGAGRDRDGRGRLWHRRAPVGSRVRAYGRPAATLGLQSGCGRANRSEEHTSELQSLMRISYAVFCLKKKTQNTN